MNWDDDLDVTVMDFKGCFIDENKGDTNMDKKVFDWSLHGVDHWDKSKVYGITEDEIVELGYMPKENFIMLEGCNEYLTTEEIGRMFPAQILILSDMEYSCGIKNINFLVRAKVKYYHCDYDKADEIEMDNSNLLLHSTFTGILMGELGMLCWR